MRDTAGVIDWYRDNESFPDQMDFDPDGMCAKIVRTARGLDPVYPSALAMQEATPAEFRVTDISKIRRGMVGFYDDPRDDNPFGHVVTFVGRVKDSDPNALAGLLVRSNSVISNKIVVVRGDYFPMRWGDSFQFAAKSIGTTEFPDFVKKPKKPLTKAPAIKDAIESLEKAIAHHKERGNDRLVAALQRDVKSLKKTLRKFS